MHPPAQMGFRLWQDRRESQLTGDAAAYASKSAWEKFRNRSADGGTKLFDALRKDNVDLVTELVMDPALFEQHPERLDFADCLFSQEKHGFTTVMFALKFKRTKCAHVLLEVTQSSCAQNVFARSYIFVL